MCRAPNGVPVYLIIGISHFALAGVVDLVYRNQSVIKIRRILVSAKRTCAIYKGAVLDKRFYLGWFDAKKSISLEQATETD